MAYFRNNDINLVNLHAGFYSLAANAGGIFVAVFLLKAGVDVAHVILAMALIMVGRFAIRPLILIAGKRTGLRPLVILGTFGTGLQYALVPFVHGLDWALLFYCAVSAIADAFYWTAFHAYFAALGDEEHRGSQTSAREALSSVVSIAAPLIGGWSLAFLGVRFTFACVAVIQVLAAAPLLATRSVPVLRDAPGAFAAARLGMLQALADGWMFATFVLAWQLVLFVSLGQSYLAFGGAMALAALAGAATGLLLGRAIDLGHGMRAVYMACGAMALSFLARFAGAPYPALAVAANALGTFALAIYTPTVAAPFYNMSKQSPCALRFSVATEGAADIGFAAGCILVATLVALGAPLAAGVLAGLPAPIIAMLVQRRIYVSADRIKTADRVP